MSLTEGLGQLPTNQGSAFNSGSSFFSSIADGAASIASNTRSRVENLSFLGGSDSINTQNTAEWFGLTMFQRWTGGLGFAAMAFFCFMMALVALPLFVIKPSKFAVAFSLGNIMTIFSIALFNGPRSHFQKILSKERLVFTALYIGSIILTLWASIMSKSYLLTLIFSVCQIIALIKYVLSYLSGSATGVRNTFSTASRMSSFLPI
ncbi:hypothetical protein BB561_003354 [Smittium simulii]|uniref:Protein transport protein SFT2 n=1 Tax=Smittium simulii TaxID=133385 RepID=A0A2T9YLU4_9FUNG|nr:hypothetical protein BB561_003354 [Smittium simulii]